MNLLDLGIWMALQSVVGKTHQGKLTNRDIMSKTVYKAFGAMEGSVLRNVYRRWLTELDLVVQGDRSNNIVEQNCGMLRENPMEESDNSKLEEIIAMIDEMHLAGGEGMINSR